MSRVDDERISQLSADLILIHKVRAGRHAMRIRKQLPAAAQAKIEAEQAALLDECAARGIPDSELKGWREYPMLARGENAGALTFTTRLDLDTGEVEFTGPPSEKSRRRRKHAKQAPPPAPPGELLDKLERSLAESVRSSK